MVDVGGSLTSTMLSRLAPPEGLGFIEPKGPKYKTQNLQGFYNKNRNYGLGRYVVLGT